MADITAPLRTGSATKITWVQENTWLNAVESALNNLRVRCNNNNSTSISAISLVTPQDKCGPMSAADFDANMTAIQNALNAVLAASGSQGMGSDTATVSLFKVGSVGPLHAWHRDTNYLTIQVCCNTIDRAYTIAGI
jgi:hypothetical protein